MKLRIHKETLYILSLLLAALAVALSVVANLGTSVYTVPSIALADKIASSLPTNWNPFICDVIGSQAFAALLIQTCFLVGFCILIRKFRPFFLLSFVTTFIYTAILYGFQWIPAFRPNIDHNYPMYLRVILLILSIGLLSSSVACSLRAYLYPPTVTFVQKGIIQHYNIKRVWVVFLAFDITFTLSSIFIIYGIYHDWCFWNYNLSYGSLATALFSGPLIGVFNKLMDKYVETKTLLPAWEKAFEIENKKGY